MSSTITTTVHDLTGDVNISPIQCLTLRLRPATDATDVNSKSSASSQKTVMIVCVDTSGSMGNAVPLAMEGVCNLLDNVVADLDICKILPYNSNVRVVDVTTDNVDGVKHALRRQRCGGGTNFSILYQAMHSIIVNTITDKKFGPGTNFTIVFMTDGRDNSHARGSKYESDLRDVLTADVIAKSGGSTAFHTIGFTSSHDVIYLNHLTEFGLQSSSFQYARDSSTLKEILGSMSEVNLRNMVAEVDTGGATRTVTLTLNEETGQYEGQMFMTLMRDADGDMIETVTVRIGDEAVEIPLEFADISDAERYVKVIQWIQSQIETYAKAIVDNQTNPEKVKELMIHLKEFNEKLDAIYPQVMKQVRNRDVRKSIGSSLQETKANVARIYKIATDVARGVAGTHNIANILSYGHNVIARRGLQKKLNALVSKNLDTLKEQDEKIKAIVAKMNFSKMKDQFTQEQLDEYRCFLTTCHILELLAEGDAIGIVCNTATCQNAIADSTQIRVHEIFGGSMMSAISFIDSAEFTAVGQGFDQDTVYDARVRGQGVVQGTAREDISGWFPIYVCREHWTIARMLWKQIAGFMVTRELAGYKFSQIPAICAHMLIKSITDALNDPTEGHVRMVIQVIRTYQAVCQDNSLTVAFEQQYNDFMASAANRTSESVQNTNMFMAQLIMHVTNGGKSIDPHVWLYILEEDLRRTLKSTFKMKNSDDLNKLILDVLNAKRFVSLAGDSTEMASFRNYMISKIAPNNTGTGEADADASATVIPTYDPNFNTSVEGRELIDTMIKKLSFKMLSIMVMKNFSDVWMTIDSAKVFTSMDSHMGLIPVEILKILQFKIKSLDKIFFDEANPLTMDYFYKSIGRQFSERELLTMIAQNVLQIKDKDRKAAAESGKYTDIVSDATDITPFIDNLANTAIALEERNQRSKRKFNKDKALATEFAKTTDMFMAAGLYIKMCTHAGHHFLRDVKIAMMDSTTVNVVDKLRMLFDGEFMGIQFYEGNKNVLWTPSSSTIHKIWLTDTKKVSIASRTNHWNTVWGPLLTKHKFNQDAWIRQFNQDGN